MHLGTFLCRPLQNNNVKWLNFTYFCERAMANFRIFFWNALGACLAWASFYTDRRTEHFYTVAIFAGKIQIHFIPGIVPGFAVFTLRFNQAFVKHWNWGSNYYAFWFNDSNYTEVKWKKKKIEGECNEQRFYARNQTNKFRVNGSWQMFNKRFYRRFILCG